MAIRNIMVAFNGSDSSVAALRTAILMHRKYGAHVTGLLAHSSQMREISDQAWVPETLRTTLQYLERSSDQDIEQQFRELTKDAITPEHCHWITRHGRSNHTVAQYARMYDLIVVGRYDTAMGKSDLNLHPDRIAMKSGRPVLVVPQGWNPQQINETAVVAWDGQRAATRAVNDAIQILETKSRIDVVSVEDGRVRAPLPGIDIKTVLERHVSGVIRSRIPKDRRSVGQILLDHCNQIDAGLLVMGAYEHSILREELLGGVTRHIMENTPLPVLISH